MGKHFFFRPSRCFIPSYSIIYTAFSYAKNNIYSDPLTLIPTISYTIFPVFLASISPSFPLLRWTTFLSFRQSLSHVIHIFCWVNFFSFIHISISRKWWRKSYGNDSDNHHFFPRSLSGIGVAFVDLNVCAAILMNIFLGYVGSWLLISVVTNKDCSRGVCITSKKMNFQNEPSCEQISSKHNLTQKPSFASSFLPFSEKYLSLLIESAILFQRFRDDIVEKMILKHYVCLLSLANAVSSSFAW